MIFDKMAPEETDFQRKPLRKNFVLHEIHKTASAARKALWVKMGLETMFKQNWKK